MAQRAKFIDLTRTFLPIDPNTLPETMHGTEGEDRPEQRIPVVPYEGWNFMPSGHGWRSYFGLTGVLNIDALDLPERCRNLFVFQTAELTNILVALCDTGVWTKQGDITGGWTHEITIDATGDLLEWSYCIIENILYVYRQAQDKVYTYETAAEGWLQTTPTTLNMAGQLGIFKAGNRLGFWDSDNALAWSSTEDKFDVTPDIGTLANITKIVALVGKIINVLQHGDGFIIYGTKSIVGVQRNLDNTFLWNAEQITTAAGIAFRQQACIGAPDSTHYAWTSNSLMHINNFQSEIVVPELYDYLKESQSVIYLKMIEGRHLFLQISDLDYINGRISFYTQTVAGVSMTLAAARAALLYIQDPITVDIYSSEVSQNDLYGALQSYQGQYAVDTEEGDCAGPGYCTGKDYGHYVDHLYMPITGTVQELIDGAFGTVTFSGGSCTFGGVALATNTSTRPLSGLIINGVSVDGYPTNNYATYTTVVEDNEYNFYDKCKAIWDNYNIAADNYRTALIAQLASFGADGTTNPTLTASAAIDVPLGVATAGDDVVAAISFYPTGTNPLTASDKSLYAFIFTDFEYELGKIGYTYYCAAKPLNSWIKSIALAKVSSAYKGPFSWKYVSHTGSGDVGVGPITSQAILDAGLPSNGSYVTVADAVSDMNASIDGASSSVSGAASFRYIDYNGITDVGTNPAGYTLNMTGAAFGSVYGSQFTLFDFGGNNSVTFRLEAAGLTATDSLTITTTNTSIGYCADTDFFHSYSHPDYFYRYDAAGNVIDSPNTPPAFDNNDIISDGLCANGHSNRDKPTLLGISAANSNGFNSILTSLTIDGVSVTLSPATSAETFTFPDASFLMQAGTAAPFDIEWLGAYVYDTHYKKWGKMKAAYRQLLDFSPINSTVLGIIPYTNFGVSGALLDSAGLIKLFDANPSDSYLKFGKIGIFRYGITTLEEIRADFRRLCTGQFEVETSLDGRSIEASLTKTYDYTSTRQFSRGVGSAGRWHNLALRGQFDLTYLEFRAWLSSRR